MSLRDNRGAFLERLGLFSSWLPQDSQSHFRKDDGAAFSSSADSGQASLPPAGAKAKPMLLSEAKEGDSVRIIRIRGGGAIRQRLLDMGVGKGAEVRIVRFAPLMDPIHVSVRGYSLALRVAECSLIDVERIAAKGSSEDA